MSSPKISVIIPAYNVEKYISRTIISLKRQTFKDIEVIVVNDGSTDNTREVAIKKLSNADFPWKVIDQKNQGVSIARNIGIKEAKGEYVHFLDGDDYIDETFIEKMYRNAREADCDIVFCGYNSVTLNGKVVRSYETLFRYLNNPVNGKAALKKFLKGQIDIVIGSAIYRREFLYETDLQFTPGQRSFDDPEFNIKALYLAHRCFCVPETLTFYVRRPGSLTRKLDPIKKIDERIMTYQRLRAFLTTNEDNVCARAEIEALLEAYIGNVVTWQIALLYIMGNYKEGMLKRREHISFIKKSEARTFKDKIRKILLLYFPWACKPAYIAYTKLKGIDHYYAGVVG